MNCPRCGAYVQESANMCPNCGLDVLTVHLQGGFGGGPPPPPPPGYGYRGGPPPPGQPQGQYPPPGYPPPPPRKKETSVAWIVVAVVVVLIAIPAVIALMWLGISGVVTEQEPHNLVLNLGSPTVTQRQIADEAYWDADYTIFRMTPRGELVEWSDVRIVIKANDGHLLDAETGPLPDDPDAYDDGADGSVNVQFWYETTIIDNHLMMEGDTLRITGMTYEYEGAYVEVFYRGHQIGDSVLPTDFP